ncbi:MAG: prephenate dehydratase domain-containing protein, partial [Patescibacteria group bacterium]
ESDYDSNNLELKFLVTAENVLQGVTGGEIDRGIFAMANSGSGAYVTSMQPMGDYQYDVLAVFGMEIMQCLIAHPTADINTITEIFGHPQAVSQCKRTLAESYPRLKVRYGTDNDDTALCAQRIAGGELPPTTATLASQIAAQLYGLKILSYNMHHDPYNTTTFLIIKRK